MARTQAADFEDRKEAILDKAAALFARSGFMGASVAELAQACGMSKSLFYHYFKSKEDVLFAAMESHMDLLVQDVEAVQALTVPPADRLKALLHRFMQHYLGAADRQKVLLNELDNLPPERRTAIVAKQRAVIDGVQAMLVAVRPDLTDPATARAETMLLFGMINWTHTWFDPVGPVSADDLADRVFRRIVTP